MKFKELLQNRYSVRHYLPRDVEKEKLDYILDCARLSPSAVNYQPWQFFVVTTEAGRKNVSSAYHREWFKSAPVYIVICGDHNQSWKRQPDQKDHCDIDVSIAATNACLAAESLGLGACWVCNFDMQKLKTILNLSDAIEPMVMLSVGYIDEENSKVPEKKRKQITEIVKWL